MTSPPAYGPFVIGDAAFRDTGSYVTGLRVTAHPTLSLAQRSRLRDGAYSEPESVDITDTQSSLSALLSTSLLVKSIIWAGATIAF